MVTFLMPLFWEDNPDNHKKNIEDPIQDFYKNFIKEHSK